MMSGLDGCLCADVTWVGSGEKEGESFHVCFSAAQCWRGTVAEQVSAWSASRYIYIYIYTPHIKMGEFENNSYNSEFHAQKQSSGNGSIQLPDDCFCA